MEYIRRTIEKLLMETKDSFKAVLVTGARQTGKSRMLMELFHDYKYVTFDDDYLRYQAESDPHLFMELNKNPVIFDEIQNTQGLFPLIKMECDKTQSKGLFLLSGSQPLRLMRNASESLAGRVGIIELSPFSLREIMGDSFSKPFLPTLDFIRDHSGTAKKPENIWEIIHRGGYPEANAPNMNWNIFYSSYVSTYLEKDVRELSVVHNLSDFRKFMVACAARTGRMLNYSHIADEVGKDAKTIKSWISILESSGIVYLLEPFANNVLKRAIKTPKLYFRDTGLAAYLLRWLTSEQLATGAMSGQFFETFVVSEILKSYSNAGIDYRYCVSYYRGKDKREYAGDDKIDLIIEENGKLHPIEIKKNERVNISQASAFDILDRLEGKERGTGAIICNAQIPSRLSEDVLCIPVWMI